MLTQAHTGAFSLSEGERAGAQGAPAAAAAAEAAAASGGCGCAAVRSSAGREMRDGLD
jgi:hypothetical protein